MDPGEIKVGSWVSVEGWKKSDIVRATQVTLGR